MVWNSRSDTWLVPGPRIIGLLNCSNRLLCSGVQHAIFVRSTMVKNMVNHRYRQTCVSIPQSVCEFLSVCLFVRVFYGWIYYPPPLLQFASLCQLQVTFPLTSGMKETAAESQEIAERGRREGRKHWCGWPAGFSLQHQLPADGPDRSKMTHRPTERWRHRACVLPFSVGHFFPGVWISDSNAHKR